jgi:nitrite transporter NirC
MYEQLVEKISEIAQGKVDILKNSKVKYIILSMLAGVYVGFGILLIFSIGGLVGDSPYKKIIMGVSFGIALSLVLMIGSELFTGNNLIMTVASLDKKVKWLDTIKIWIYSYIGNLLGSVLVAGLFVLAGCAKGPIGDFFVSVSTTKMTGDIFELFFKGVLCNMLVCLAVLSYIKLKEETAKLIMIFWCLFAFITSGFEHSIANMTAMSVALMIPGSGLTIGGFLHNIIPVTLGNMVGGAIFIGMSYWYIGRTKR